MTSRLVDWTRVVNRIWPSMIPRGVYDEPAKSVSFRMTAV